MGRGCDFLQKVNTEEEALQNGFAHTSKDHGMKAEDMTTEMCATAISFIRRSLKEKC
jgi:predicted small metal-binding protein